MNAQTSVYLAPGARYVGWDLSCLGRAAAGDFFTEGDVNQRVSLYRRAETGVAEPLLLERNRWRAGERLLTARWGLAGYRICGTLYATPASVEMLEMVRPVLSAEPVLPAATATAAAASGFAGVRGLCKRFRKHDHPRNPASTRSGRSGSSRGRHPVALNTALPIDAGGAKVTNSPMPTARPRTFS